jgi:hypothetical protein
MYLAPLAAMLSREEQYMELDLEFILLLSSASFILLHIIMLTIAATVTKAGSVSNSYIEKFVLYKCNSVILSVLWSRSIFVQLRLQLVKNFGSGSSSDHFPKYCRKNSRAFMVLQSFLVFKAINNHSKVLLGK